MVLKKKSGRHDSDSSCSANCVTGGQLLKETLEKQGGVAGRSLGLG